MTSREQLLKIIGGVGTEGVKATVLVDALEALITAERVEARKKFAEDFQSELGNAIPDYFREHKLYDRLDFTELEGKVSEALGATLKGVDK